MSSLSGSAESMLPATREKSPSRFRPLGLQIAAIRQPLIRRYALMWVAAMKPSPTMPMPTGGLMVDAGWVGAIGTRIPSGERSDKLSRHADVRGPPGPGFALDTEIAGEFHLGQRAEESPPIHFAGAEHDFPAPVARFLGSNGVFEVALLQPGAQGSQRFDGIALVVEDHVGRVEIHPEVRAV